MPFEGWPNVGSRSGGSEDGPNSGAAASDSLASVASARQLPDCRQPNRLLETCITDPGPYALLSRWCVYRVWVYDAQRTGGPRG